MRRRVNEISFVVSGTSSYNHSVCSVQNGSTVWAAAHEITNVPAGDAGIIL